MIEGPPEEVVVDRSGDEADEGPRSRYSNPEPTRDSDHEGRLELAAPLPSRHVDSLASVLDR